MIFLDEIYQSYIDIDCWMSSQQDQNQPSIMVDWLRKLELTRYAFFVLLFGQLEDFINHEYEQIIGPAEEVAFIHRVNCLFDENDEIAEAIKEYYSLRCDIAHGHAESGQIGDQFHLHAVYSRIREVLSN